MEEYLVTLNKGVDFDAFWTDMETPGGLYIPDRSVDVTNRKPASIRTTGYELTAEEAVTLENDPRVLAVQPNTPVDAKWIDATQSGIFSRASSKNGSFVNWGLRCGIANTIESSPGSQFTYTLDGTGVDIVIQDNGVMTGHPEWEDANGVTRLKEIDWYAVTGVSGSMSSSHYGDVGPHGTHVAGTAAGKTYGWAKNANIYSMRFDSAGGIPDGDEFDLIRIWHQQKPVTATGFKRPTIVNASWGYRWYYPGNGAFFGGSQDGTITELNYRGANVGTSTATQYGNVNGTHNMAGVAAADAACEDMTDAGVIFVKAAGNYYHKQDVSGGNDYNNFYKCSTTWAGFIPPGDPVYYHRPGSPHSDDTIVVANVSNVQSGVYEDLAASSEKGPRIDVCAPGSQITSSTNSTGYGGSNNDYPPDSDYNIARISGTSMASPQVCGLLACFLQINPGATAQQCKNWLANNSKQFMNPGTGTGNDYGNSQSLQGAPNRFLHQPFSGSQVLTLTG
jgi:hypothetical protein